MGATAARHGALEHTALWAPIRVAAPWLELGGTGSLVRELVHALEAAWSALLEGTPV